jgi:hypothetical protein
MLVHQQEPQPPPLVALDMQDLSVVDKGQRQQLMLRKLEFYKVDNSRAHQHCADRFSSHCWPMRRSLHRG